MPSQVFTTPAPRPPGSRLWECLVRYWQLTPTEANAWWRALWRSRRHRPMAWRQAVLLFEARDGATLDGVFAFVMQTCAPEQVTAVLEALVEERQLSRGMASQIEERLRARVDRAGRWY